MKSTKKTISIMSLNTSKLEDYKKINLIKLIIMIMNIMYKLITKIIIILIFILNVALMMMKKNLLVSFYLLILYVTAILNNKPFSL